MSRTEERACLYSAPLSGTGVLRCRLQYRLALPPVMSSCTGVKIRENGSGPGVLGFSGPGRATARSLPVHEGTHEHHTEHTKRTRDAGCVR